MTTIKTLSIALALALAGCVTEYDASEDTDQIESELVGDDIIRLGGPSQWCGGSTWARVTLSTDPVTPMTVTLTVPSGVSVTPSKYHTFTSDNWTLGRTFLLTSGGTITASSPGYPSKTITIKRTLLCR